MSTPIQTLSGVKLVAELDNRASSISGAVDSSKGVQVAGMQERGHALRDPGPSGATTALDIYEQSSTEAYGHNARVFDLAFCPIRADLLASASDDGTAKVWEYSRAHRQHRQAASFHGHTDSVLCLGWNAAGDTIASGSADTTVQLWKPGVLQEEESHRATYGVHAIGKLEGHPEEVYAAEFLVGTSGQHMMTASVWMPFLWDLETCRKLAEGAGIAADQDESSGGMPERWQAAHIFCARQMPEGGPLVAAACSDGAVRLWSVRGGGRALAPHACARVHRRGMGSACAWDPDSNQVASVATDGSVAVVDVRMNLVCWALDAGKPIFGCQFVPGMAHTLAICGKGSDILMLSTTANCPGGPKTAAAADVAGEQPTTAAEHNRLAAESSGTRSEQAQLLRQTEADLGTLSLADPRGDVGPRTVQQRNPTWLRSRSKNMANRNLLCLALSGDGSRLAASGDAVVLERSTHERQSMGGNAGDNSKPSHLQSKRSAIEVWGSP